MSGLRHLKLLLKPVAIVLGIVVIFYAGYELAIFQAEKNNLTFTLPHINFTSSSSDGNCPPGEYYGYPPLANPTRMVCLAPGPIDKPVIYLYPSHPQNIDVKVAYAGGLSRTIPTYSLQTGWQVVAQPNGSLTDLANGKTYPDLVWEGKPDPSLFHFDMSKGFVVAGSNTEAFLQEKLTAMGLNRSETSGFIAFWLPKMEHDPYNLIHFAGSEYTNAVKLNITPQPDTILRVFMVFSSLRHPINITPQSFKPFRRQGFTVVEWGGTELVN